MRILQKFSTGQRAGGLEQGVSVLVTRYISQCLNQNSSSMTICMRVALLHSDRIDYPPLIDVGELGQAFTCAALSQQLPVVKVHHRASA